MLEILPVFLISLILAYCSENEYFIVKITKNKQIDLALIGLIIYTSFFCGLRIDFNDTYLYIRLFNNAPTLSDYLNTDPEWSSNPAFYAFQSFFRHNISENFHLYLTVVAFFTNSSFILFIKRHSTNFLLSILIYFSIELFTDNMGFMKQCIAMAILTYAIEALLRKKYLLFYFIVFFAVLWHTYAIFFVILPFFKNKPWTLYTYIAVITVIVLLLSFESTISMLQTAAEETGKNLSDEELLDNNSINFFRLAVFAVPPLLSFFFQTSLNNSYDSNKCLITNISILSFLVMLMGIFTAANLFARCAAYFEIGSIVIMPWIINEIFDKKSAKIVSIMVGVCYTALFWFMMRDYFDYSYSAIGIGQFFHSLNI